MPWQTPTLRQVRELLTLVEVAARQKKPIGDRVAQCSAGNYSNVGHRNISWICEGAEANRRQRENS